MNNQKRDNNECKECCKLLVNDCFDILFDKYIITNEDLSLFFLLIKLAINNPIANIL